jgi:ureidoacrylate peracid hydrolase
VTVDIKDLARIYPSAQWPEPEVGRLGLLIIDMQRLCVDPERGMLAKAQEIGRPDLVSNYADRLKNLVLPGVGQLAHAFREAGRPVIFTRIHSTSDSGSRSASHVALGINVPEDSPDGEIIDFLEVCEQDTVISKTTSDSFVGTNLADVLDSLGVDHLAVCGVLTNECVESTVRHAADLHFTVHLLEDGCAALTQDMHDQAIRSMTHAYARNSSIAEILPLVAAERGTQ